MFPTRSRVRSQNFKTDFTTAVQAINEGIHKSRLDSKSRFDKVSVLLLMWENDDLQAEPQVKSLREVFRRRYGFAANLLKIPHGSGNANAFRWTQDAVQDFMRKNDGPNNLCIIYYSGHADCPAPYSSLHFFGDSAAYSNGRCTSVDWLVVRASLAFPRGRVVLLFDCCYSASVAMGTASDHTELLAASAMESPAAANLRSSFTAHLITLLERHVGKGISVAELNAIMVQEAVTTGLEHSLWHKLAKDLPSVTFSRHNEEGYMLQHGLQRPPVSNGKVLISVALEGVGGTPNPEQFIKWLTNDLPANVKQMSVEAVFESQFNLLLITVPTEVWSCLLEHPAMNFVSHVTSNNLLLDRTSQTQAREIRNLSMRPVAESSGSRGGPFGIGSSSSAVRGQPGSGPYQDPSRQRPTGPENEPFGAPRGSRGPSNPYPK